METADSRRSYIMMITSLVIVGTIGVFRRFIPLSSSLLAFFRGLIGSVSLMVFVFLIKRKKWSKTDRKKLVGMIINGAFIGINWILLFEAFNYTTIAKATLAYYMQPTIVLLLSPLVFHEKLTARKLICATIALFGMVLVSGIIGTSENTGNDLRGVLFGLGAACFYSMVVMINKKIEDVDSYQKTIIQLLSAAVTLIPYLLIRGEFNGLSFDVRTILLVLAVCIFHTGFAYALYFGSMNGLTAQTISVLSYIDPVTAMLVSSLVLGEKLSAVGIIGAVLILGSAFISEVNFKPAEKTTP